MTRLDGKQYAPERDHKKILADKKADDEFHKEAKPTIEKLKKALAKPRRTLEPEQKLRNARAGASRTSIAISEKTKVKIKKSKKKKK
jgi:hypothetical protein